MFGRRWKLFRAFGIPISVDASWIFIAVLITWSLGGAFFPQTAPGLSGRTYWVMGLAGMLGLFASILFHELAHALVARRHGIPMRGITLFIFGGVAEMGGEPPTPKSEFWMAIAGPAASTVLAALLAGAYFAGEAADITRALTAVVWYLAFLNAVLALFNMIPAFPLDGGRVLRAVLWHWRNDLKRATRTTSRIGAGFGMLLMVLGLAVFVVGRNFIGGMWYFLIGMFLRNAARMAYSQLVAREILAGEPVRGFMKPDVVTVPASTTLEDFVDQFLYRHHYEMFPVVSDGRLLGSVTLHRLKEVPRESWKDRTVGDIAIPCNERTCVPPDMDSVDVLGAMNRNGNGRLLVVEGDRLLGVVTLKDILSFLSLKVELEGDGRR